MYKAKKNYFCNKFENCARTIDPLLKIGETTICHNSMITEVFNDFFVSNGPKLSVEIDYDDVPNVDLSEDLVTDPVPPFILSEISEYGVFLLLSNLKPSKSTGIDSIPARILKLSAEIIWS